jgi:hypothetical protein
MIAGECTLRQRLERRAEERSVEHEVEIVSSGRNVELNPFAESIVINTLAGLLGSLKDVKLDGEIRVVLKPKARR